MFLRKNFIFIVVFCLLLTTRAVFAGGDDWREITQAERDMKTSKVEPGADAEAIFWDIRIDDSTEDVIMKNYIRVKIFTERGREKYSKVDIPFAKGTKIKNIMARVIKPDGSIVDLSEKDIFEREIVKADKIKIKAKSFAVPNIETGSIVEYRYQEVHPSSAASQRMVFQHEIPIESIAYYFKPANNLRYITFNMDDNKFVKDKNGFFRAGMENVPAIKEEPQMPPEDEVRSWLIFYYTDDLKGDSSDFWSRAGGYIVRTWDIKDTLKPSKDLKTAAAQITAGASDPDEKIAKIFDFCKTKVKNITYDTQLTDDQKEEIKSNKSTGDTYKKLQGTSTDINELFASLTTAAGFEARLAFGGDRSEKFFNPQQAHVSFIHFSSIAVKVNGRWQYYDPGSPFVPYQMLAWNEEKTSVLLLGYKDYITTETPLSGYDKSMAKRTGKFKLLDDGTLEGTVKIEYTGQLAYTSRMDSYKDSATKQEDDLKDEIKSQISTAEISDIKIQNVNDAVNPLVYEYKVRVPNYAQRTGKRLFLQPGFFEYGKTPMFSTSARKYAIYFHYPWSEQDNIQIELPKGFSLDNADAPAEIADPDKITDLKISMAVTDSSVLKYNRSFYFGKNDMTLFPVEAYKPLKNMFDSFNKANLHTVTLKQN